jgi:hypothetical protein
MSICYPPNTDWSCYGDSTEISKLNPVVKARSEALAWYTLARLCAYQIGVCPTTIRPCAASCAPLGSWLAAPVGGASMAGLPVLTIGSAFTPHLTGGNWVNSCGHGRDDCGCGAVSQVILPGPVGSIEEVKVDGLIIDSSRYRVDNGNLLVSTDPTLTWPICQDVTAGDDEVGSFVVTYYRGAAPNELTRGAAGILAAEFYKACNGGKCRLPSGVSQVVRNGVTITINTALFENGETGIREVDAVIGIYNPNKLKQMPTAFSPDSRAGGRGRRTTWMVG